MTKILRILGIALPLTLGAGIAHAVPVMHVDDSSGILGRVDVATGSVSVIGNMGVVMTDIAFNPTGQLFGLSFTGFYSINPTTAAATFIGNHSVPGGNALVFATDGTLYAAGFGSQSLFTINPATGAGTNLGNISASSGGDLAFNGGNLFLATSTNALLSINLANLATSAVVGPFGVSGVFGLATGDDGVLYAVAGTQIFTVNTATGAATNPINDFGQGLGGANGQSFFTEACGAKPGTRAHHPVSPWQHVDRDGTGGMAETEAGWVDIRTTRRVIFLDIDGVLAPILRWDRYGDLDPACIRVLNEIVAGGGADVVVSSTWRHGKTVAELQEMLDAEGFAGRVLDKTPTGTPGADRGDEIAAWLAEHAVGGYVIIDDHSDMGALRPRLVQTHPARGLQPADAARAIEILTRPGPA